jgi:hypothetical protein
MTAMPRQGKKMIELENIEQRGRFCAVVDRWTERSGLGVNRKKPSG